MEHFVTGIGHNGLTNEVNKLYRTKQHKPVSTNFANYLTKQRNYETISTALFEIFKHGKISSIRSVSYFHRH